MSTDKLASKPWCFFDVDGVLVYECGVAYAGYLLQLDTLRKGVIPSDYSQFTHISDNDKAEIDALRPLVKGLHFTEKIRRLSAQLEKLGQLSSDAASVDTAKLTQAVMEVQRAYIRHHFQPERYRVTGADNLLRSLSEQYHICTLTANDPSQTAWILGYVDLLPYFDDFLCYDSNAPHLCTKGDLLQDFGTRHPEIDFTACVVIGDGIPDIQAGNSAGCFTVGVCACPQDYIKLNEANLQVPVGAYGDIPCLCSSRPVLKPLQSEQTCSLTTECSIDFDCQCMGVSVTDIRAAVIWDVSFATAEKEVACIDLDNGGTFKTYRVMIPLNAAPQNVITNVNMILFYSGSAAIHRQLFRVAYVGENATVVQML